MNTTTTFTQNINIAQCNTESKKTTTTKSADNGNTSIKQMVTNLQNLQNQLWLNPNSSNNNLDSSTEAIYLVNEENTADQQPPILRPFFKKIISLGDFSEEILILGYILCERFLCKTGLNGKVNLQKIFSIATFIAQKMLNDMELWYVPEFSIIFGIKETELKEIEFQFAEILDFNLNVSQEEYRFYISQLIKA